MEIEVLRVPLRLEQPTYSILARLALLALLLCAPARAALAVSFINLGTLNGVTGDSRVSGVSADGSTVVGSSDSATGTQAFRWVRHGGGLTGLGVLPGLTSSIAQSVNADGSVVAGKSTSGSTLVAFRWDEAAGMTRIEDGPLVGGNAPAMSSGGSVIGGRQSAANRPYLWDDGVMQELPLGWGVNDVSGDGLTIMLGKFQELALWTDANGLESVSPPAGVAFSSGIMTRDATTLIGHAGETNPTARAAYLTRDAGSSWIELGDLPGVPKWTVAQDISDDGQIVVGTARADTNDFSAFIWDETNGMMDLQTVLENQYGLDLAGWELESATGISADGMTIAGTGRLGGTLKGFVVFLPEPSSGLLLALGLLGIGRSSGRRRRGLATGT